MNVNERQARPVFQSVFANSSGNGVNPNSTAVSHNFRSNTAIVTGSANISCHNFRRVFWGKAGGAGSGFLIHKQRRLLPQPVQKIHRF